MTSGFILNPLGQEVFISQTSGISHLGGSLSLTGVEAEQSGYRCNHVGHGEALGAGRHDVGTVKLDWRKGDAALGLANARLDEGADEGLDVTAGWAPRRGPEGQEGRARGRREGEMGLECVIVADWGKDLVLGVA